MDLSPGLHWLWRFAGAKARPGICWCKVRRGSMKKHLLAPFYSIALNQMTTVVNFSKVRLRGVTNEPWLSLEATLSFTVSLGSPRLSGFLTLLKGADPTSSGRLSRVNGHINLLRLPLGLNVHSMRRHQLRVWHLADHLHWFQSILLLWFSEKREQILAIQAVG